MVELMKPLAKVTRKVTKIPAVAKILTKASRNKPEIMAIGGGILVVWAFVDAVRGGMKMQLVMEKTGEKVQEIEARHQEELKKFDEEHPDGNGNPMELIAAQNVELKKARKEGTWRVVKLFLPAGVKLIAGMGLAGGGFRVLKTRYVVSAGAAEGYKKLLENYRKNVVDKEGKEADLKYLRGAVDEQEVSTVLKDENGNDTGARAKKKVPIVKEQHGNPWRFEFSDNFFDSYEDDTDRNLFFLKCEEDWWNHELDRHGEVSMYEILKHLQYKFDVMKAGCKDGQQYRDRMTFLRNYGWRKGCGDGFIDFGLYRAINEAAISRQSDICWLEFNCSGNLQNLSEKDYEKF